MALAEGVGIHVRRVTLQSRRRLNRFFVFPAKARTPLSYKWSVPYRSSQSGFCFSISSIFHARRRFLIAFCRAIASAMSPHHSM
jgi:hypothetical protein